MFLLIKVLIYLISAHIFYNAGFASDGKLLEFVTLMSCVLLMDICSYFTARHTIIKELFEQEEE